MHPLAYKQRRQLINALRRSISTPREVLALLIVLAYGGASLAMIAALLVLPLPDSLLGTLTRLGAGGNPQAQLQALRGALTLTLLLLASTAAFQNPLLQFAPADIDMLFAAPVPLWRVLLGKLLLNHLRALFAGLFFWGLAVAPTLRLMGYQPWPIGGWALLGLACLFASVDQGFALAQTALMQRDTPGRLREVLLARGALLLFAAALLLLAAGLAARAMTGNWHLLMYLLSMVGGSILGSFLLPLSWATDLLFLPTYAATSGRSGLTSLTLAGLLLLDGVTGGLLLRYVQRHGASLLVETVFAAAGRPTRLYELLRAAGPNPLRIVAMLWRGAASDGDPALEAPPPQPPAWLRSLRGAQAHIWRRVLEMQRQPLRNLLALLALGLIPLAIYNPAEGYGFARLLTAMIFSASLSTQLFNDAADHLRYADLELSAPVARWRLLLAAYLPRLVLYWLGGLLLLGGVGMFAAGARRHELFMLALWYPLMLTPLLALRGALVFIYPAAGIPGRRDPVQAVLVMLINGLLVLLVIMLSLLPFGVLLTLARLLVIERFWIWPIVFASSGLISLACCTLLLWAYRRYEPGENPA